MNLPVLKIPERMPPSTSLGLGRWETYAEWAFTINDVPCLIPPGFICDLYSVPFPLSIFIPKDESDNRPALVHDWLFATVGLRETAEGPSLFTLDSANKALLAAMQICGFPWSRRTSIYTGVQLGGWHAWNKMTAAGWSLSNPCMK